jgi:Arc/MetJ family transcription regulator
MTSASDCARGNFTELRFLPPNPNLIGPAIACARERAWFERGNGSASVGLLRSARGRPQANSTMAPPRMPKTISVDEAVGAEIVRLLQLLGVEAAVHAITECEHQSGEKQRQLELTVEQARYEAARARRQCDTVDPDNRLVAGELESLFDTPSRAREIIKKIPPCGYANERALNASRRIKWVALPTWSGESCAIARV